MDPKDISHWFLKGVAMVLKVALFVEQSRGSLEPINWRLRSWRNASLCP